LYARARFGGEVLDAEEVRAYRRAVRDVRRELG